ncbi:hypothetical protein CVT24_000201 [Panaeolus cyanescens]|uniref:Cytochrome P450 n=1 Tax=Panaeolus cyanescens TaxID=181874 RepID=A0A409VIP1_9AGAR|nr:hypothetical protein CVT24_000201 [Panaeolus cyanescens]
MQDIYSVLLLGLFTGAVFRILAHFTKDRPLSFVRGPKSPSFVFGHLLDLNHSERAGELERRWVYTYGQACRIKGSFGQDLLLLADPKALHHIFHVSGHRYPKPADVNESIKLIMGRGIFSAVGDDHKRHKKIMIPAFEPSRIRSFLDLFHSSANKLAQYWEDEIQRTNGSIPINVYTGISHLMLDNIGEGIADGFMLPGKATILFRFLWRFISTGMLGVIQHIPARQIRRLRHFLMVCKQTAKEVLEKRSNERDSAEDKKDMLSSLVRSNASADIKRNLDEDELLSQIATIMFAGHDSTSNSLAWLLYDLACHPKDQERLREEIARVKSQSPNPQELTIPELKGMEFTNAVMRESLRLHPMAFSLPRIAAEDDVIPLATPIRTTKGGFISAVPVKKGQYIQVSVYTYNRQVIQTQS